MKAVILAAGVSRRLYPLTYNIPKSLMDVGGKPIINRQLEAIQSAGIKDVIIVVGYYREAIIDHVQSNFPDLIFEFVINHHYFETNTAYSLRLCDSLVNGSAFVLMNADVLYPHEVLQRVIHSRHGTSLAVDIKDCGREEVKVIEGDDKRLVAIGKEIIESNSLGEFIGVAKFSNNFSEVFMISLNRLIEAGGIADYFEAAIHPLLPDHPVYYVNVSDLPCIEIDFIEDLEKARELVDSEWFN